MFFSETNIKITWLPSDITCREAADLSHITLLLFNTFNYLRINYIFPNWISEIRCQNARNIHTTVAFLVALIKCIWIFWFTDFRFEAFQLWRDHKDPPSPTQSRSASPLQPTHTQLWFKEEKNNLGWGRHFPGVHSNREKVIKPFPSAPTQWPYFHAFRNILSKQDLPNVCYSPWSCYSLCSVSLFTTSRPLCYRSKGAASRC